MGSLAWDSGAYAYDGAGNIVSIGTDNYLYDGVQRLHQSSTQGTPETYTYDGFGNMQTRTNTIIPTVQPSTNRYDGYLYNEVGAVTSDGSYVFSYDALGQPLSKIYNGDSSKLEYYIYTPGDERIGVQRAGWWIWSVRDEGGKVLRQFKSSSTNPSAPALWLEDFVWRDGLLLGSQRPVEMGGRRHFHLDHLGSPRLITADNGQMVSYHDYYPFGDEHSPISQEVAHGFDREDPMKFTGHERDYAGGMGGEDGHAIDDMHARYYATSLGRFLSVDPIDGNLGETQSWNRYTYGLNNPIDFNDPLGLQSSGNGGTPQPPDCPPGTQTGDCGITVKPPQPPVPQLPTKPLHFFWNDHPYTSLMVDGMRIDRNATLRYQASRGDEFAMMQLGMAVPSLEEDDNLYMLLAGGVAGLIRLGSTEATVALPKVAGFTKHAINQAISRDGVGVSSRAILDALKNPVAIKAMSDGTTRIIGRDATVVVNELFRVVTLWARNSGAVRILP